jgi:signal transduction histidine kinase
MRGVPYRLTFRDRIFVALLLTAVLPLILIVYYAKNVAEQRLMEETAERLERETNLVVFRIVEKVSGSENSPDDITNSAVEEIAKELNTDLNFYVDTLLRATSRQELYAVGVLDRRLSGNAYSAVVIRQEKFHQQTENVGRYRYAVGYRPVHSSRGVLLGIVSVPTLYRQDELDRQISRQSAFLFGVYAFMFFIILIVANTVAARIASPIQQMTEATRKVSRGEFDVALFNEKADGEIGELMHSFEAMTRDLKRQREELVRYEREMAWKQMAKQVAHEIKNPLTPMKLSLQHLRQTYRDRVSDFDKILEEVTKTCIDQVDALSRIASEFSRFGRLPKANIEPWDINVIVEEALRLFEQEGDIEFETEFAQHLPKVRADNEELRRAFINIVRNGVQAMNGRGKMMIRTSCTARDVIVAIRDFGPGIPKALMTRLFEPNFSTKTEGMGLGLAIVKKTIDDLGGRIVVESKVNEGTEVTIALPALS